MQKISFRNALAQCGIGAIVLVLAFIGSFLIREARSFVNPASAPGASGVLGPDVGVIGNPANGISGANTLFKGQAAIKSAVDGISCGGTGFVGVTTATSNGNMGGWIGANAKCAAQFGSGAHICTERELHIAGVSTPPAADAWIHNDVSPDFDIDGLGTYAGNAKFTGNGAMSSPNCNGWTNGAASGFGKLWLASNGNVDLVQLCTNLRSIACCK